MIQFVEPCDHHITWIVLGETQECYMAMSADAKDCTYSFGGLEHEGNIGHILRDASCQTNPMNAEYSPCFIKQ